MMVGGCSPDETKTFQESYIFCNELGIHQLVTLVEKIIKHTILTMFNNFRLTSLEQFPSRTSNTANMPWEDTNWECISGASSKIFNLSGGQHGHKMTENLRTSWSQASWSWKSGEDGASSSISWLTVLHRRAYLSRCKFASRSSSANPSSI